MASLTACASWFAEESTELPPTELTEFSAEFSAKIAWDSSAGDGAGETTNEFASYWQNDKIYAVDHEGEVYAFNAETGRRAWDTELDVETVTGVGGGMDLVFVGSKKGLLFALDAETGEQRWQTQLSSEILAPPSAASGIVVARTSDGRVSGVATDTGAVQWSYQRAVPLLSLRGAGAPVITDEAVIAGYDNGKLVALSVQDGKVLWEKSVAVPRGRTELERLVDIDADPLVINDTIYVVSYQGNLSGVDLYSGQILWSREMSSTTGLDAIPGEAIYVTDDDGNIWAIQDGSGDALWRQTKLERRHVSAPAVVGDYIVVGDLEGYVHWIARDDGRFVSRQRVSKSPILTKPLVKDGLVYITSADGSITAVRVP
jgi:outer membrane protein assembly factor BamB